MGKSEKGGLDAALSSDGLPQIDAVGPAASAMDPQSAPGVIADAPPQVTAESIISGPGIERTPIIPIPKPPPNKRFRVQRRGDYPAKIVIARDDLEARQFYNDSIGGNAPPPRIVDVQELQVA